MYLKLFRIPLLARKSHLQVFKAYEGARGSTCFVVVFKVLFVLCVLGGC